MLHICQQVTQHKWTVTVNTFHLREWCRLKLANWVNTNAAGSQSIQSFFLRSSAQGPQLLFNIEAFHTDTDPACIHVHLLDMAKDAFLNVVKLWGKRNWHHHHKGLFLRHQQVLLCSVYVMHFNYVSLVGHLPWVAVTLEKLNYPCLPHVTSILFPVPPHLGFSLQLG